MIQTDFWSNFHLNHDNVPWGKVWFKCPACGRELIYKVGLRKGGKVTGVEF